MPELKPETKLMSAIYGCPFHDQDLCESVDGVTLTDTLFAVLEDIREKHQREKRSCSRIKQVVILRFGFNDGQSRSYAQTAREFGLSRERIAQQVRYILRACRHPTRLQRLQPFIKGKR
jgi:RNA polymerase primary sigma factor